MGWLNNFLRIFGSRHDKVDWIGVLEGEGGLGFTFKRRCGNSKKSTIQAEFLIEVLVISQNAAVSFEECSRIDNKVVNKLHIRTGISRRHSNPPTS